jgi:uncharacterized protein YciU (UPF0263 family)
MADGEMTKPALAELAEQGATAEGDDASSVAAAAMLAVDLAAEEIDFAKCRVLAVCFEDDGSIEVYSVPDEAAEKVKAAMTGDGIESGTIAAADIERAFSEAMEVEEGEHEAKRPSVPPAPEAKK